MSQVTGWLLDVYPNYEFNYMTSWLKRVNKNDNNDTSDADNSGNPSNSNEPDYSDEHIYDVEQFSEPFDPKFYVYGSKNRLQELTRKLRTYQQIKDLRFSRWRIDINDHRKYTVLEVVMRNYRDLKPFAAMIDREGKFSHFQLYNVDLRLSQKYMLEHGVFPLARVSVGKDLSVLSDDQFAINYTVPELHTAELEIKVKKQGRVVKYDDPLDQVTLGDIILEDKSEVELLLAFVSEVARQNPDIILTGGGDSFVIPYLYHRAEVNEINAEFQLGREPDRVYSGYPSIRDDFSTEELFQSTKMHRQGKSYFTYGQIRYKPPFYAFKGRIHLDKLSSFIYLESGLYGLIELSRLSGVPLQTMSRLSPGTAISSMQMTQALRDGVLIRWKKNIPEGFKDARTLHLADRGGHIFDPKMGVHENVLEIDFASLYPNIISIKNISPETLLCSCCADDPNVLRVPAAGYHICRQQRGLIPRVIDRILERRVIHKRLKRQDNDIHDQRQKVLKWVLVTCLSGDTIIPHSVKGKIRFRPISKITEGYMCNKEGVLEVENDLKVFGLTEDIKSSQLPVKRIFKFRSPTKILHIKLQNGRELRITKDHPCYYLEDGILKVKLADELANGDYLPITTKININKKNRTRFNIINSLRRKLPVEELPLWRAYGNQLKDAISRNYDSIRLSASDDYSNKSIWNWREYSYLPFQYLNHLESINYDKHIEYIGRGRRNGGEIQKIPNQISLDFDLGFLMGYFVGDGNAKNNMVRFAINMEDHDVATMLQRIIHEKFNLPTTLRKESHANMNLLQVNSIALKRIFEISFGLSSSAKEGKLDIPDIVLNSNSRMIYGFLSGMVASDGHVSKKRNFIGISTCDSSFARKLGLMLSVLGIEYRLAYSNKIYVIQFRNKRQLEIFFNNGWLKLNHRKRVEDKLRSTSQIREVHVPVYESGLIQLSRKTRSTRKPRITRKECISREDAQIKIGQINDRMYRLNYVEKLIKKNVKNIIDSDLSFQKIVSIKEISPTTQYVYCFEVEGGLPGFIIDGNIFTHNCFGYTGYRNARFGRIECHESITAFAREILLDAMEVAEERGYKVLHGIVDSLWVTTNSKNTNKDSVNGFEELCRAISERVGVNIEFEGYYRWIVFLPNKSTGVGALTRYYGLLDSGKFKVRGVEFRQRSTPKFFIKFQQEILDTLTSAKTKLDLLQLIKTDVLQVVKNYALKLLSGNCDPHELVFAHRVTRGADEYRVFNHRVAALMQLNSEGVEVHPGETVHYVVLNHTARDPNMRVRVHELMDGTEKYDKQEYLKHLCRATDSLLRPFGYTEEKIKNMLGKGIQIKL